ncbi:hypothetical protein Pmani_016722 [Petrolisthes manimaculis]|uniref:Uncharacterized protein n=1 Tax=Petrolisthes manimaculis TaxID=1843537 RepID=A0AAE1U642_9EUCA|nr:hypothetical protein Pmani_016722 [Petrolisthes manimaculis]
MGVPDSSKHSTPRVLSFQLSHPRLAHKSYWKSGVVWMVGGDWDWNWDWGYSLDWVGRGDSEQRDWDQIGQMDRGIRRRILGDLRRRGEKVWKMENGDGVSKDENMNGRKNMK